MRILLVDILTFDGFFGVIFDILTPKWLPTLGPENDDSTYEYSPAGLNDAIGWIAENHFHLNDISRATLKKALQGSV